LRLFAGDGGVSRRFGHAIGPAKSSLSSTVSACPAWDARRIELLNTKFYRARILDGKLGAGKIRVLKADRAGRSVQTEPYIHVCAVRAGGDRRPGGGRLAQYPLASSGSAKPTGARGDKVLVAVIDSASTKVIRAHRRDREELDCAEVADGPHSHGTAIAGIIAGHTGLTGLRPPCAYWARASVRPGLDDQHHCVDRWAAGQVRASSYELHRSLRSGVGRTLAAARQKARSVRRPGNAGPKSSALWPQPTRTSSRVTATDYDDGFLRWANRGSQWRRRARASTSWSPPRASATRWSRARLRGAFVSGGSPRRARTQAQ